MTSQPSSDDIKEMAAQIIKLDKPTYDDELRKLADQVIAGELTLKEADNSIVPADYSCLGLDLSCELHAMVRTHAMEVAPEWTAFMKHGLNICLDAIEKRDETIKILERRVKAARYMAQRMIQDGVWDDDGVRLQALMEDE